MAAMKIRPIGNRICIKLENENKIVSKDQKNFIIGKVIGVGNGRKSADKKETLPLNINTGDRVLFDKRFGTTVEIDGQKYIFMREHELIAVLEN